MKKFFMLDVFKMLKDRESISATELKSMLDSSEGSTDKKASLTEEDIMNLFSYDEVLSSDKIYEGLFETIQEIRIKEGTMVIVEEE